MSKTAEVCGAYSNCSSVPSRICCRASSHISPRECLSGQMTAQVVRDPPRSLAGKGQDPEAMFECRKHLECREATTLIRHLPPRCRGASRLEIQNPGTTSELQAKSAMRTTLQQLLLRSPSICHLPLDSHILLKAITRTSRLMSAQDMIPGTLKDTMVLLRSLRDMPTMI